jgi:hypothetical protein
MSRTSPVRPVRLREVKEVRTGLTRQDNDGHVRMSTDRHQLQQDLEARHIRQVDFKNDAVDRVGFTQLETGSSVRRFEDFVIGPAAPQAVGIISAFIVVAVDERVHLGLDIDRPPFR